MNYFALFLKKTLRYLLKPLSFVPALVMMYVIYSFSDQTGEVSSETSYKASRFVVLLYDRLLAKDYSHEILNGLIADIHPLTRKLAHVGVYFLLALSVALPLYAYRIRGFFLFLAGGFFCVAFACLDEYHQSLVAGRGPSLKDVGIDSIGIAMGLFAAELGCFIGRKTFFAPLSLEGWRRKKRAYKEGAGL